jgi:hypothetical protein
MMPVAPFAVPQHDPYLALCFRLRSERGTINHIYLRISAANADVFDRKLQV